MGVMTSESVVLKKVFTDILTNIKKECWMDKSNNNEFWFR